MTGFFGGKPTKQQSGTQSAFGLLRECDLSEAKQIRLVAEFHANRIRPSRIAYRLGIDIALIDALLAGEYQRRFLPSS